MRRQRVVVDGRQYLIIDNGSQRTVYARVRGKWSSGAVMPDDEVRVLGRVDGTGDRALCLEG